MRPVAPLLTPFILVAVLAGCTAGRQDGDFYSQGSISIPGTFYAELYDAERRRWYVFMTESAAQGFRQGDREMPLSKTLIGAGPGRTTVVLEQVKDAEQNAIRGERVLTLFRERHPQTEAPAPATSAAATN